MNKVKRVVIAGCRNYFDYEEAKAFIDLCLLNIRKNYDIIIVSGGAKGADSLGEQYAIENGFEIEQYLPNWDIYGKGAGHRRNRLMAEVCDCVICFWDGQSKGTKSMISYAKMHDKPIKVKKIFIK